MKKLRLSKKKQPAPSDQPHRITNDTVAEHRERILAGGRRFKYPVQYARHRLVINTLIISVIALVAVVVLIWWQLYPQQNTSTFFYRITKVVPLPVAMVDGQAVRYSDYLVGFRSQEHYLQHIENVDLYSKENKSYLDRIKRQALDDAIADGYAAKLAAKSKIKITEAQIYDAIKHQRQSRDGIISQDSYDAIVLDHFNWTPLETREVTARRLLKQEVAYSIDTAASKQRDEVVAKLKTESDFDKVAAVIPAIGSARVQSSVTPLVPVNNQDGGLAEAAAKLPIGQISQPFRSTTGDGYYIVKPLQNGNGRVSYAYIKIPLTVFDKQLELVKSKKHIDEFISIPALKTEVTNK